MAKKTAKRAKPAPKQPKRRKKKDPAAGKRGGASRGPAAGTGPRKPAAGTGPQKPVSAPGLLPPVELATAISAATPGAEADAVLAAILADLKSGAPHESGLISPVHYAAWLLAERAEGGGHD